MSLGSFGVAASKAARDMAAKDASRKNMVMVRIGHPGFMAVRLMRALAVSPMMDNNHEVFDDKS
jgi:hypothetical protein